MKKALLFVALFMRLACMSFHVDGQCLQLIHVSSDTTNWRMGSDHAPSGSFNRAYYRGDTVVLNTPHGGQNNYIYSAVPVNMSGVSSTFTASFDFRIGDSSSVCSDGLTFWFFTSGLTGLGSTSHEGSDLGFPDTSVGFALAMRTTVCWDDIYMKKISSNHFSAHWGTGTTSGDTNLCTPLTHQMFLSDGHWHHCAIAYNYGNITVTYDGGAVVLTGYNPIIGTGHFGFMATNGGGSSQKCVKNVNICTSLGVPTVASDSFGVFISHLCNGPQLMVMSNSYSSAYHIITLFGDGTRDSSVFAPAIGGGYAIIGHSYPSSGNYSIRQILYRGSVPIDTLLATYDNIFCTTIPVKFYTDINSNGQYDSSSDAFLSMPVTAEIDSNGVPVDTISSSSGFYYSSHGVPGDIYAIKILTPPGNMYTSSPSSGILYDTILPGTFNGKVKYIGFNCSTGSSYDLSVRAVIPVTGVHDQWGNIYVQNNYCASSTGTLTLHYSSKYAGAPTQVTPAAASAVPGTIVWNLSSLTSRSSAPLQLHWEGEHGTVPLTIGDTVHSYLTLTPMSGDSDTTNNVVYINDTVRAGCDSNEMFVTPAGGVLSPTRLQYTINFENTGNDTAHNIYVMDTLSDNLDISTMRFVMSSHEMYISKLKDAANHNVLKFDFPHIDLLDSSHHSLCDGTVIFSIRTKSGLAESTIVANRAGIYFDVNDVVMTNEVNSKIVVPNISFAPGSPDTACYGNAVRFVAFAPSATHYQWSVNGAVAGTDSSDFTVNSLNNSDVVRCRMTSLLDGTTVVNYSNSITVPVKYIPNAGTISGSTVVCPGAYTTMTSDVSGGIWTVINGHASVTAGGAVAGVSAGNDTICYSLANVCGTGMTRKSVTVFGYPNAGTISGPFSVCAGATITLSSSVSGGTWSASNSLASVSSGVVTGISGGTDVISYSVTNACGTNTALHSVLINPLPSAGTIAGPSDVCVGSAISLTNGVSGGVWTTSNAYASIVAGVVNGISPGFDTVFYTVTNSCGTARTNKVISVHTVPISGIITGINDTICIGRPDTLSSNVSGGVWSVSNGNITINSAGIINGVTPGSDSIYYTVSNYCGTANASRNIQVLPVLDAGHLTGPDSVCKSGSITVITDGASGGNWTSMNGKISVTSGTITGLAIGTDIVSYSLQNFCGTSFSTHNITVNPLPDAGIITGASTVCDQASIDLVGNANGGQWLVSNSHIALSGGGPGCSIIGISAGTAIISYLVINSCGSAVATFDVTVNPLPDAGIITGTTTVCIDSSIMLSDVIPNGTWSISNDRGVIQPAATGIVIRGAKKGIDTLSYTVTNNCGAVSAIKTIFVDSCFDVLRPGYVNIFPNPATTELTIETRVGDFKSIIITNSIGSAVVKSALETPKMLLPVSRFPAGVYFVILEGPFGLWTQRFVKE